MAVNVKGDGALEFDAIINNVQLEAMIKRIEQQLGNLTTAAQREADAIERITRNAVTAISAYASFTAASNFVTDIVRVRSEFQQLEVAFTTMLGSKEKADKLLKEATEAAAKTPFTLTEIGAASKQLLAYGFAAEDIVDNIKMLGNVASGVGAPLGDIVYLYGTLRTQGRAFQKDITQFTGRGINIVAELAKQFGVAQSEVSKLVEAGKVGFPEVEKAFKSLTSEGGTFFNLMEEQSKTLQGQLSNLRDSFDNMLNEFGKQGEGVFEEIIAAAQFLIEHFREIIKILEVLVITYGSYRAALVATAAIQSIATARANGMTVSLFLQAKAAKLAQVAQDLLNRTVLKHPAAFLVAGIAGIVAALTLFNRRASEAERQQKMLNDVMAESQKAIIAEKNSLEALVKIAKDENQTKQTRENAIKKINAISPEYLGNLTLENLKTQEGIALLDKYVKALEKKALAQAISNKLTELQGKKLDIENEKLEIINKGGFLSKQKAEAATKAIEEIDAAITNLSNKQKEIIEQDLKDSENKDKAHKRTLKDIDEELKALKEAQTANSSNAKEYQEYQKKINALEEERKKIIGASKAEAREAEAAENKALAMLEKKKDLLDKIKDLIRQSNQSGQEKQLTELDRINEKYDDLIENIHEYNEKVEQFNKKNPKNQVQKIGQVEIVELNKARTNELDNQRLKEDADRYKLHLESQKNIFEQYEEAKKRVGITKANEMFAEQTKGFDTFIEFLNQEALRLFPKIQFGIANIGEIEKFKAITDQIAEYNRKKSEQELKDEQDKVVLLLQATVTFNEQKVAINQKYDDLEATLEKNRHLVNYEEKKKLLEKLRKEELDQLAIVIARSSDLYKKLNEDILLFTRTQLKERIKVLKDTLKNDTALTPQMKRDIQNTIDQYDGLLDATNETAQQFSKIGEYLAAASNSFGTLADSLEGVNSDLSEMFTLLSDITNIGSQAAAAIGSFAAGDIVGGIQAGVAVIASLFSMGKRAREERRRQQQEVEEFLTRQFVGEFEINRLYRERTREQVTLNKLRLQGIADEKKLLLEQKDAILANYNTVFAELQKLSAKVRKKGLLGIETFSVESLAGKSFEELEALFLKGQLEGKAKELFETLQRLKQEGLDVDQILLQNAETMKELLTGTTADGLTQTIMDAIAAGKTSVADLAETFEDLMKQALLRSLQFKYLEGPLKDFFEEFAAASESEGQLTSGEIGQLKTMFDNIITNASQQFEQLQQLAGLNFNSSGSQKNSLSGAIKGMSEQQADLLAGQFGGLRLTALEQLLIARQSLTVLQAIQVNTGTSVQKMESLLAKLDHYYGVQGVKVI